MFMKNAQFHRVRRDQSDPVSTPLTSSIPRLGRDCGGTARVERGGLGFRPRMFGEALPAGALAASWGVVLGSPVCLVVGTGLNVAELAPG